MRAKYVFVLEVVELGEFLVSLGCRVRVLK